VQNKFRRVSSENRQLRQLKELHLSRNRIEKLSYVFKFIHNKFTIVELGFIVHLQRYLQR